MEWMSERDFRALQGFSRSSYARLDFTSFAAHVLSALAVPSPSPNDFR